jgi:hypothetical protein
VTSLAATLGFPNGARVAILHVDDVGMCHGANVAFLELARAGAVDSGSVMAPARGSPRSRLRLRRPRTRSSISAST